MNDKSGAAEAKVRIEKLSLELYARILQTANQFLHKCKHSTLTFLKDEKPTYAEMARNCELLAEVVGKLVDASEPMRYQQVLEYCALMVRIGYAIEHQDEVK